MSAQPNGGGGGGSSSSSSSSSSSVGSSASTNASMPPLMDADLMDEDEQAVFIASLERSLVRQRKIYRAVLVFLSLIVAYVYLAILSSISGGAGYDLVASLVLLPSSSPAAIKAGSLCCMAAVSLLLATLFLRSAKQVRICYIISFALSLCAAFGIWSPFESWFIVLPVPVLLFTLRFFEVSTRGTSDGIRKLYGLRYKYKRA